jgi:hypothetical protein
MATVPMPDSDVLYVLQSIPKDVRELVRRHRLVIAGGFIRALIAREKARDLDLFGSNAATLRSAAQALAASRGSRLHETKNAITLIASGRLYLQFITRWTYADAAAIGVDTGRVDVERLLESFDFTVAQAGICWDAERKQWVGRVSDRFYQDLAARRLVYTRPVRDEEAGGSLMRVRKFLGRGYSIQIQSFARVIARLVMGLDFTREPTEEWLGKLLTGLLREVDPLVVVDGVEVPEEVTPELLAAEGMPGTPEDIL